MLHRAVFGRSCCKTALIFACGESLQEKRILYGVFRAATEPRNSNHRTRLFRIVHRAGLAAGITLGAHLLPDAAGCPQTGSLHQPGQEGQGQRGREEGHLTDAVSPPQEALQVAATHTPRERLPAKSRHSTVKSTPELRTRTPPGSTVSYSVPTLVLNTLCKNPPLDKPAREPNQTRWMVAVRGERYSGTSWARQIITLNVPESEYITALYGHKHGDFTPEHASRLRSNPQHLMMFLWRNVFTWLLKMYQDPYCEIYTGHGNEHAFMRPDPDGAFAGQPRGSESQVSLDMLKVETNFSYFLRRKHKMPDQFGMQSCTFGESPSFMHVRSLRYRNWLAQISIIGVQQTAGLQYEMLGADNGKFFFEMLDRRGVPRTPTFIKADTRVKYGQVVQVNNSSKQRFITPVEEYMSRYTLDDIVYVLERLDPAVEHFAGYATYDAERQWTARTFGVEAADDAWSRLGKKRQ